ncbi:MAG: helix-turn-helix domain-containing protein [Acidaminococcales bacterium]|jgi:transcriptional regulator with XRE-family HTH domain|nr:helix-turn-helix domain-containing protein [Acidaminococcales bacterium]
MDIKHRIYSRRKQLDLTLEEVAQVAGVGKSTVRKWETGEIDNMKLDKIELLAKALRTSPAWLMGWEGGRQPAQGGAFGKKLAGLRAEKSLTQKDLAIALKTEQQTISDWETGRAEPDHAALVMVAEHFGVSIDFLLDRTSVRAPIATIAAHMINPRGELTSEEEEELTEYLKFMREKTARKKRGT